MRDFDNLAKMEMSNAVDQGFVLVFASIVRHYKGLSKAVPWSLSMQLFHLCWENPLEQLWRVSLFFGVIIYEHSLDCLKTLQLCLLIKKLFLFLSGENLLLCSLNIVFCGLEDFFFFSLIGTFLCALKNNVSATSLWHCLETSVLSATRCLGRSARSLLRG